MKAAFFKGTHPGWKGIMGRLTKLWMVGPYSHCELVVGEPDADGLSTCWSSTFLDKGVRQAKIALDSADWDILDLPLSAAQEASAVAWFESNKGAPYDVLALFGFFWRPIKGFSRYYFCDEALLTSLGFGEAWRQDPNSAYQLLLGAASMLRERVDSDGSLPVA
ncbi:hypothetical protein AWB80_07554 [Caballeronia pedi]|uniref:Uncharacterized protein n=1 Tax=Caballeronia pedi TaxID=1777141 RepID=A0A158DVY7_9BURK|nr:hypothetical protein [Caballeronia pedi]SAK98580.1 hypothetical protein AWB80_07554 [Caballeronia pedi]